MRATILLTAMLVTGASYAEGLPPAESVALAASPEAPAESAPPIGDAVPAAAACPCEPAVESSPIDLGAAPEPESVVTITPTSSPSGGAGSGARSWINLQTSGTAASTTPRPLPGDAASNAYERYANSFKHPIPETFKRESFATDGGQ